MYTKREFDRQLETLCKYYEAPIHRLMERTGLTRPTVQKFLNGYQLRAYNQDKLIETVIQMNEEALKKRESLQKRGQEVVQLDFQLNQRERRIRKLINSQKA